MGTMFSRSIYALITFMMITGCSRYYHGDKSNHYNGAHFFNPGKPMDKGFTTFLKWKFTADKQPWPEPGPSPYYDKPPARVYGGKLRVSYVGHATVLIQTRGLNILTDPVWSERAGPFGWAGPRRVHPPGIEFEDLPVIDIIITTTLTSVQSSNSGYGTVQGSLFPWEITPSFHGITK